MAIELNLIADSRNVHSAAFDETLNVLSVRFWRYPKGEAPVPGPVRYDYLEVDPEVAKGFFAADSKTRYLDSTVKPAYGFTKVDLTKQEGEDGNG